MARRRECIWKTLREHTATSVALSPSSFGIQRVVNMIRIVKQVFASSADETRGTMMGSGMKGCESHNEYVELILRAEQNHLGCHTGRRKWSRVGECDTVWLSKLFRRERQNKTIQSFQFQRFTDPNPTLHLFPLTTPLRRPSRHEKNVDCFIPH